MKIFKHTLHIDFVGKRRLSAIFSAVLILVAIGSLLTRGLSLGIDFTGGTLIEVGYPESVDLGAVRTGLVEGGFKDATAQHFGTSRDVLVRIAPKEGLNTSELSDEVFEVLKSASGGEVDLRRVEFVGPQVGEELTEDGGLAMLYALIGILVYVGLRFEWRFALGSVVALVHDVLITLGVFSLFQFDFDLPVLAALLAVIGYSLNDTIVVFDRIRENFRKIRKGSSEAVVNTSLNETFSRTVVTSVTTLIVLLALALIGGEIIHGFALALIIGVVIGTYSSIFVASTTILALGISRADLAPVKKEGDETAEETP